MAVPSIRMCFCWATELAVGPIDSFGTIKLFTIPEGYRPVAGPTEAPIVSNGGTVAVAAANLAGDSTVEVRALGPGMPHDTVRFLLSWEY